MEESEAKLKELAQKMREAEYAGLSDEEIAERERAKDEKRKRNIEILEDTLKITQEGLYIKEEVEVRLRFSLEEMREIMVFLPEEQSPESESPAGEGGNCAFGCENKDALEMAREKCESGAKPLVLNLASATRPGGQVRSGADAQEEALCRRTSLLLSLESEAAKKYYDYNNARKTRMGSDAVMISPNVEVIKDASGALLDEPFAISVMSCAAPMVRLGLEGMTELQYEAMMYKRICDMLYVASSQGYRHLILGAFGCGMYGNDAAVVSDLFYRAICNFSYDGKRSGNLFDAIGFAVLCRGDNDYNYRQFCRNFG
ncbi:MAG: TIGR02452 family protein [Clostridia bacterium]|nr:TIGR02452 family protein [Clostridia bacterium]